MPKLLFPIFFAFCLYFSTTFFPPQLLAQENQTVPPDQFATGKITQVGQTTKEDVVGYQKISTPITVEILSGPEKGQYVKIDYGNIYASNNQTQQFKLNEKVVIVKSFSVGPDPVYFIPEKLRLAPLIFIVEFFFVLVILLSRSKGFGSILGLFVTIFVLIKYIVPQIVSGANPLTITILGSIIIAGTSLYLAHGFNRRTTLSLISTLLTLAFSSVLAIVFANLAKLYGTGSEEAYFLQIGTLEHLNLRGLLLGGMIIGTLGVLDDITTSQTAAVDEIYKANPKLSLRDLYRRGLSVGHEHIASLVNTLVLAYAGASLPIFLLFSTNTHQPLWVTLNSEFVAEELVRTIVGSIALVVAVPISTILASYALKKFGPLTIDNYPHPHHH